MYLALKRFLPNPRTVLKAILSYPDTMLVSEMESIPQEADTRSGAGEVTWPCDCILHHEMIIVAML